MYIFRKLRVVQTLLFMLLATAHHRVDKVFRSA